MTGDLHPVEPKDLRHVAAEWDAIAAARADQLIVGDDPSYFNVLVPTVLDVLREWRAKAPLLDAGCGVGVLTERLAAAVGPTIGVDVSAESIRIAETTRAARELSVSYVPDSIQSYAAQARRPFPTVVANMLLMDAPDLDGTVAALADLCEPGGLFVATITHPWFWPLYWGYAEAEWFRYDAETFIEAPFAITAATLPFHTTHVHRPLAQYTDALRAAGFEIEQLLEPSPRAPVPPRYLDRWRFPRFLVLVCTRVLHPDQHRDSSSAPQ